MTMFATLQTNRVNSIKQNSVLQLAKDQTNPYKK